MWLGTKKIYLVRHAESELNFSGVRQGREGKLTMRGRGQAERLAERLSKCRIGTIITSPYERTRETAAIISSVVRRPVEESELLIERRNPTEIIGRRKGELDVQKVVDYIDKSIHPDSARYSDEENFEEIKERAIGALHMLQKHPQKRIVVVSHALFITVIAALVVVGESLTAAQLAKLAFFNAEKDSSIIVENTAVAELHYKCFSFTKNPAGWQLVSWNDTTHLLGDI